MGSLAKSHKKLCHLLNPQQHLLGLLNVFGNFPTPQWPLSAPPETGAAESALRAGAQQFWQAFGVSWSSRIKCRWWQMFPAYQTWLLVLGISTQSGSEQSAGPGKVTADSCSAGIADLMSFSSACGATAGQCPVHGEGEHAALGAQRCKPTCVRAKVQTHPGVQRCRWKLCWHFIQDFRKLSVRPKLQKVAETPISLLSYYIRSSLWFKLVVQSLKKDSQMSPEINQAWPSDKYLWPLFCIHLNNLSSTLSLWEFELHYVYFMCIFTHK